MAQDSQALKDTYVCNDITASFGGWQPPISSITIELEEANIPKAYLIVDPAHTVGDDVESAIGGTLNALKAWHDKAQAIVADPASTAQVLVVLSNENGGQQQHIVLSDWIVVAAGLTGAATGQFTLEIQIQHPAGRLDRSVPNLGNAATEPDFQYEQYDNPLSGFILALNTVVTTEHVPPTPIDSVPDCANTPVSMTAAFNKTSQQMKTKVEEMERYLEWNTSWPENSPGYSNLPMAATCLAAPSMKLGVQYALTAYAYFGDHSIWSSICNTLLPEWQLTIIPTFWRPTLQVLPYSPWGKPSITVYDDEISDISCPGVDPAPVGGIRIFFTPSSRTPDDTYYEASQEQETQHEAIEVLYIPPRTLSGLEPIGRILQTGIPSWLSSVQESDSAYAGKVTAPDKREEGDSQFVTTENIKEGDQPTSSGGSTTIEPTAQFVGAAFRYAHQVFLGLYRANVEASFTTCLLFRSEGSKWDDQYVVPGCVVRLAARSDKSVFFDMYLERVTHVLSAGGHEAYTTWAGTHCRSDGEVKGVAQNGDYNPVYAKSEGGGNTAGGLYSGDAGTSDGIYTSPGGNIA